jgi:DUF1680 family protein
MLVNTSGKNEKSLGTVLEISCFRAASPLDYRAELKRQYYTEYALIEAGQKGWKNCAGWRPVPFKARMPERGVRLNAGVFRDLYDTLVNEITYDAAVPHYCTDFAKDDIPEEDMKNWPGWSGWLPGSNEGRMLAGAAGVLRWDEDETLRKEMRAIVDKITGDIKARMREDGYVNYYEEKYSYAIRHTIDDWKDKTKYATPRAEWTERKNYDRVFLTRGLLAAAMAGNKDAPVLLRRFYDWFNSQEQYLKIMLCGSNATNGLPGGPLVYLSPCGKADDLITSMRYLDQDYWARALAEGHPQCFVDYPGERPHCYGLLSLEAFLDEYLATGDEKYGNAVRGGWEVFKNYYLHTGGFTAISEVPEPNRYYPGSNYITTKGTGEICGQVFWLWINQRLMQLHPREEQYALEAEEALFNTLLSSRQKGKIGSPGHIPLTGKKAVVSNPNGCCQVSSTMAIASMPQLIYMTDDSTLFVNLYIPSAFDSPFGKILTRTAFPASGTVDISIDPKNAESRFTLSLRIPRWAEGDTGIFVNGEYCGSGTGGKRFSMERQWKAGDTVSFTLAYKPRLVRYQGVDQESGGKPRYTVMYGPVLMAVLDPGCEERSYITHIPVEAETLPELLKPEKGEALHFRVPGTDYVFVPYWDIPDGSFFTCVPAVSAN